MDIADVTEKIDERAIRLIARLDRIADRGVPAAWLVGGSVRDILLGRSVYDYDICTALLPGEVIRLLPDLHVIETGMEHGTVTVLAWGLVCEVTTLREEGDYSDKRHPDQVRFVNDLELDLARRDFTMNAIAWHPASGLIDPLDGRLDLRAGLIRSVGDPLRRFSEDALRILRAIRFSAELDFRIEAVTAAAMDVSYMGLHQIARERIIAECRRCMNRDAFPRLWLEWPQIWELVFPQLARVLRGVSRDGAEDPALQAVYLANRALLVEGYDASWPELIRFIYVLRPLSGETKTWQQHAIKRLRLPRQMSDRIINVAAALRDRAFWSDEESMTVLAQNGLRRWEDDWSSILLLAACLRPDDPWLPAPLDAAKIEAVCQATEAVLREGRPYHLRHLAINGRDLISAGYPAGHKLGSCLNHLLDRVIGGTLENEREALLGEAGRYFSSRSRTFPAHG